LPAAVARCILDVDFDLKDLNLYPVGGHVLPVGREYWFARKLTSASLGGEVLFRISEEDLRLEAWSNPCPVDCT
jgi:hypothetical protein